MSGPFGLCPRCLRNDAPGEKELCRVCAYVDKYDAPKVSTQQVGLAIRALKDDAKIIRWPYVQLDALCGPMKMGQVIYVVAGTGIGKTTFAVDLVRRWVTGEGVPMPNGVTVLPLETDPRDWRTALAANLAGINHGDVPELSAKWAEGDGTVADQLEALENGLRAQVTDPMMLKNFHLIEDETVTLSTLQRAFAIAKAQGHKVVLIDHIDQVGDDSDGKGGNGNGLRAVEAINNEVLRLARMYEMVCVCMSQANGKYLGDGTNALLRYRQLELQHVMYSTYKTKNAAQIIGIFRPLRINVSRYDFALAKEGTIEPTDVLAPERMGINTMKLRFRGRNEGRATNLVYRNGRLRDMLPDEKLAEQEMRLTSEQLSHNTPFTRKAVGKTGSAGKLEAKDPSKTPDKPARNMYMRKDLDD